MSKRLAWTFTVAGVVFAIGAVAGCAGDSTPLEDGGLDEASAEAAVTDALVDASVEAPATDGGADAIARDGPIDVSSEPDADATCSTGTCRCATAGETKCGGVCVNLQTDNGNCGGCGLRCAPGGYCAAGSCPVGSCSPNLRACGGVCVDQTNDFNNCGACGHVCPAGSRCLAGACDCMTATTGLTMCGSTCVPLLIDAYNCGACGSQCLPGSSCQNGACAPCPGGETQCGAQVVFVNALGSQQPLRVCWAQGGSVTIDIPFPSGTPMLASNYAGIPVGGGAWLDRTRSAALVSQGASLYAVSASALGMTDPPCYQLTCSPGAQACWPVQGAIPAGPLRADQVYVAAIGGCLGRAADLTAETTHCGPGWEPVFGNLHLDWLAIDNSYSPTDGGVWSVQAAQLSPGLAFLIGDAGTALVSYGMEAAGDAGIFAHLLGEGTVDPRPPATFPAPSSLSDFGQIGFAVAARDVDAGSARTLWMSLAQSQQLVAPTKDPTAYYGSTGTYLVAILGDPNGVHASADAGYDGTGLHVLVLPPRAP